VLAKGVHKMHPGSATFRLSVNALRRARRGAASEISQANDPKSLA